MLNVYQSYVKIDGCQRFQPWFLAFNTYSWWICWLANLGRSLRLRPPKHLLCLDVSTHHLIRTISASQQSSTAQSLPTQFFRWIPILFFLSWIPRNGNRFSKPIKKNDLHLLIATWASVGPADGRWFYGQLPKFLGWPKSTWESVNVWSYGPRSKHRVFSCVFHIGGRSSIH